MLKIDRLDHGNRSIDDEDLVKRLADEKIALTVCPLSNLKLKVVEDLADHPIRKMLNKGLVATVNSDDPAYFGGYMNANFLELAIAIELTKQEIKQLVINSFESSFIQPELKKKYLEKVLKIIFFHKKITP